MSFTSSNLTSQIADELSQDFRATLASRITSSIVNNYLAESADSSETITSIEQQISDSLPQDVINQILTDALSQILLIDENDVPIEIGEIGENPDQVGREVDGGGKLPVKHVRYQGDNPKLTGKLVPDLFWQLTVTNITDGAYGPIKVWHRKSSEYNPQSGKVEHDDELVEIVDAVSPDESPYRFCSPEPFTHTTSHGDPNEIANLDRSRRRC